MFDVGTERMVLAGIAKYGENVYYEVSDILSANCFTIDFNQCLYRVFKHIFENNKVKKIDPASILSFANEIGLQHKIDNAKELRALFAPLILAENVRAFAVKLRKLEIARSLKTGIQECDSLLDNVTGDESIEQILSIVEKPFTEINASLTNNQFDLVHIGDGMDDFFNRLEENPVENIGIPTKFRRWDYAIGGGVRPSTINLIGARPKQQKSQLVDCMAMNVCEQGIPTLMLDTEMTRKDHWVRMTASRSQVFINDIERGIYVKDPWKRKCVNDARNIIKNFKYSYASVAGRPFDEIIAIIKRWIFKVVGFGDDGFAKPCVVFYDYFKLMSQEGLKKLGEHQVLGFQIMALHNFLVRFAVPCVATVQLNRDGRELETMEAISQSDRLGWNATNFTILKAKTDVEVAADLEVSEDVKKCTKKFIVTDCRHGPGLADGDYINLFSRPEIAFIEEYKTRNELHNLKAEASAEDKAIKF